MTVNSTSSKTVNYKDWKPMYGRKQASDRKLLQLQTDYDRKLLAVNSLFDLTFVSSSYLIKKKINKFFFFKNGFTKFSS
mgnify:CR=1 FL=1